MSRIQYVRDIKISELSFMRIYEAIERRIANISHTLAWLFPSSFRKQNIKKLKSYYNIHKGKRCFILANGPSLKSMDLSNLANEFSIGMNQIYRNKEQMGFLPTYLVVSDVKIQLKQFSDELSKVRAIKFFNWNGRKYFPNMDQIVFFKQVFKTKFSIDFAKGAWGGHSVTNICIQLAYYMGFDTVIIIGKDHNYIEKGIPGQEIESTGKEKNHFISGYYKKGMKWKIPDYKGEELGYNMARMAFEADGRNIYDATIGGKLSVFEKINYYDLFKNIPQ